MADAVLLIDDDVDVLRAGGAQLERAGYEVTRELSGEAGLATWDRIRPDIVVLDLDLPGHGKAPRCWQHLRERSAAVIVLAPAGSATAVAALQAGAEAWVLKPVDQAHLEAAIGRVSETVRLRRVTEALLGPGRGTEPRVAGRFLVDAGDRAAGAAPRRAASAPRCCWRARWGAARAGWRGSFTR